MTWHLPREKIQKQFIPRIPKLLVMEQTKAYKK
jgi:hypothetical protein